MLFPECNLCPCQISWKSVQRFSRKMVADRVNFAFLIFFIVLLNLKWDTFNVGDYWDSQWCKFTYCVQYIRKFLIKSVQSQALFSSLLKFASLKNWGATPKEYVIYFKIEKKMLSHIMYILLPLFFQIPNLDGNVSPQHLSLPSCTVLTDELL